MEGGPKHLVMTVFKPGILYIKTRIHHTVHKRYK